MRGRSGCPTGQKKNSAGATVAASLFYKERLRPNPTDQAPDCSTPKGFGVGSFPAGYPILPPNGLARQGTPRRVSPPAGGERKSNHVLTGSAGQNILLTPRVPASLAVRGASPNFGRGLPPSRQLDTPVLCPPERSTNPARPSQNSYSKEICVSPRSSGFSSAPAAGRLRAR